MSAQIIQFGKPSPTPEPIAAPYVEPVHLPIRTVVRATTATAKNQQLRLDRRQAWRKARAATDYWRAVIDFCHAVEMAAREGMREACSHSRDFSGEKTRWHAVCSYREAVRRQIFTAAPDIAAVNWKRVHLDDALYAGAKMERMQQIIANDLAFLKSHPTRKSRAGEA